MTLLGFTDSFDFSSFYQLFYKYRHKSEVKRTLLFFIILNFISISLSFSQGELDLQPRLLYKNERSGGVYLNSNGFGAGYRIGRRVNARIQNIYEIDLMNVKHPKEVKITNSYYSNRSFIFGKENTFLELCGMLGRQNEIFRKNDRGGIAVRFFYLGGPTLGLLKPIYYDVIYSTANPYDSYLKAEKYNTTIHQSNIYGKASILKGINEIRPVPGASVKTGFGFEYSKSDIVLHSFEAGFSFDAFARKIPIMANTNNNFLFFNMFISYRFGKYIDISEAAIARRSHEADRQDRKIRRESIRKKKKMDKEENYY